MANAGIQIPESFSWLLSAHGLVAGVVIYSTYYVFSVGSIPFILSVVAAGLHLLLATYFCFAGSRRGTYHLCIIPPCVLTGAGLWAAVLYYFASVLALLLDSPAQNVWRASYPLIHTWIKVGTATAALNVALDFSMLAVFLIAAMRRSSKPVISAPVMYAPQQQQQQQHVVYPPYPPPPQQQQQQYRYQYHAQPHPHHSQQAHYSGIYTSASPPPPAADYKPV